MLDKENNQQSEMTTYGMGEDNCNHIYDKQSISKIYKKLIELRKNKHSRLENGQRT